MNQYSIQTIANTVTGFVGLKMNIRSAFPDSIKQDLVNEANYRCLIYGRV